MQVGNGQNLRRLIMLEGGDFEERPQFIRGTQREDGTSGNVCEKG